MNDAAGFLAGLVTPILSGLVAALLTYFFGERSAKQRRRDEWRANKLSEAYNALCYAIEYQGMTDEQLVAKKASLEKAINMIDLYGSKELKSAANKVVEAYARRDDWISYMPLMTLVRDEFRKAMGMEKLDLPVNFIIFHQSDSGQDVTNQG
ncbi:MAG: hypothetical protein DI533_12560 [Cereibacter sphaeroides]|uniref:Uncharacterized protein n=1 Tax=Cereibacter sphaeroides TaxID=1063 RepID=A0A2W5S4L8_CERSP|nr:MAG: hypothetical protein DI533_12560 [Cereibacter sphaeroides]